MDNLDKIILCMEKENSIYEKLLSISQKKKEVIIDGKIDELDSIIRMEGTLVLEISKLEDEREKAVDDLAKELGFSREELSISHLCSKLGDKRTADLKKIADSMGNTLKKLKDINDINGKLIEQSLEYVNFSLNLVTSIMEEQQQGSYAGISLFDAKV